MNEAETRAEHIDPALKAAGWGVVEGSRIRARVPDHPRSPRRRWQARQAAHRRLRSRIPQHQARRRRSQGLTTKPLTEGVAQAKDYATKLAIRFTYATNGHGIYGIDMQTGGEGEHAAVSQRPRNCGT